MRRRQFIALSGAVMAWPLTASAQQASKIPRIGYLATSLARNHHMRDAFLARLRELGYEEGRNLIIETEMPMAKLSNFLIWPLIWSALTST